MNNPLPSLNRELPEAQPVAPVATEPRRRGRPKGSTKSKPVTATEAAAITGDVHPTGLVDRIAGEHLQKIAEADAVLMHICQEQDGRPTAAQIGFFAALGWHVENSAPARGQLSMRRELSRMSRVLSHRAIAGTEKDREAMTAEVERSAKELKVRGEELRQAIAKAEAELRSLERAANLAVQRHTEAHQAVENLRQSAPAEIERVVNQAKVAVNETLGRKYHDLDTRKLELEVCSKLPFSPSDYHVRRFCGAELHPQKWSEVQADMRAELEALLPAHAEAKQALDEALEAAREPLNYYVL